jgi:vacuolar protein sorting-associated protein 54
MSAKLVEEEQWSAVDIPKQTQRIADILVDSAVHDPPELKLINNPTSPTMLSPSSPSVPPPRPKSPVLLPSQNLHNINGSIAASAASSKHLRIEERAYYAVSATTEVIGLLADYMRIVIGVPMLTTDTMSRAIEFLKAFNSRTCQVVLGAGAMRSAGLKNITAKHLGELLLIA